MPGRLSVTLNDHDLTVPPSTVWTVEAEQPVSYSIKVSRNVLDPRNRALLNAGAPDTQPAKRRRFVVIDREVHRLYGRLLRSYFDHHYVLCEVFVIDATEQNKSLEAVASVVARMDDFGIDRRREPVIAVGGGVLLDIVGLATSLYRRGTPYIRVPTTLIGLVDAGVGVKTGVNFNGHKNRLGTYEAPVAALLDRSFLKTMNRRHLSNGLAEILKIALVKDAVLFENLEAHGRLLLEESLQGSSVQSETAARTVLRRAVQGMLEELQPNLRESKLERLVDYGHTFSPAIEMAALPDLLHGEAVALDMALTTEIAYRRGLVSSTERDRVVAVMAALDLPVHHPTCIPDLLARALADTTRHRDGQQRLPLPRGIGDAVFVNDVTQDEIARAGAALAILPGLTRDVDA